MNLIRPGNKIRTLFCSGIVEAVIDGRARGWRSTTYFEIRVTSPRLHHSKRRQIVRLDEVRSVS